MLITSMYMWTVDTLSPWMICFRYTCCSRYYWHYPGNLVQIRIHPYILRQALDEHVDPHVNPLPTALSLSLSIPHSPSLSLLPSPFLHTFAHFLLILSLKFPICFLVFLYVGLVNIFLNLGPCSFRKLQNYTEIKKNPLNVYY